MQEQNREKTLRKTLIKLLNDMGVIQFGNFVLSSGKVSDYYVDIKRAITEPSVLKVIAELITLQIGGVDRIAGPALGAVPIATAVSMCSGVPLLIIRKKKKDYGTSKLIEGELNEGDLVVVVEDVTTTGNSLLRAVETIEENGGRVVRTFVVVDREEGALEAFRDRGIDLRPLVSISDFRDFSS